VHADAEDEPCSTAISNLPFIALLSHF